MNRCSDERMKDMDNVPELERENGQETVNRALVTELGGSMPDEEMFYRLSELYKVFGDSTRIKILYALFEAEMCVCDIAALLGMNQSAISHQLRVLKQSQLVKFRRDGKAIYYSLDDDHVRTIIGMGIEHLTEE